MPYSKKYEATLYNREWLRRVYVEEKRNANQVAQLAGATRGAVHDALKRFDIPVKDRSEAAKLMPHPGSNAPRPRAKFKNTLHNEAWLRQRWEARASVTAIAEEAGCSVTSASVALQKFIGVSKHPSPRREEVLERCREKNQARKLYPDLPPCLVCGEKASRNHIDGDWKNHVAANIEPLCMRHHLMLDKRLASWATGVVQREQPERWRQRHDEILAEIHKNPEPYHRN